VVRLLPAVGFFVAYLTGRTVMPEHSIWQFFASPEPQRSLLSVWGPWSTASGRASRGAWSSKKRLMASSTVADRWYIWLALAPVELLSRGAEHDTVVIALRNFAKKSSTVSKENICF